MNERIKELRKTLGLTMEKFGCRLGVTKMTISRIENGVNNVTEQMKKSICREFNVDYIWLTTGEGKMFQDKTEEEEVYNLLDEIMDNYPSLKEAIAKFASVATVEDLESLDALIEKIMKK